MKLTFLGAAREVTGSMYLLEAGGKRILIDCGLQQGRDVREENRLPVDAWSIDCVLLTHAHIDHSGRIPLMVKEGFAGRVITTRKTGELIEIMLRDSAHIQETDAKWENQKGKRAGLPPIEPLYTLQDAQDTLQFIETYDYYQDFELFEGASAHFIDAGHLLGSASIVVCIEEDGVQKRIALSGDIGNIDQPIIRDPQHIEKADYVVMESTYGDRDHEESADYLLDLAQTIDQTLARGGNVVIPSFAVGRTQELLYFIREIKERALVASRPDFKVFVDSPLSTEATRIYAGDLTGYADQETLEVIKAGKRPLEFPGLHLIASVEESKLINSDPEPKVIISSSGMCEAGRIRHHLKHNLWREECTVLFVGYQAHGTLGRILLEGAPQVKLFGEQVAVKARILRFHGLSAHADRRGLLRWIDAFAPGIERVFVVHGESDVCDAFAATLFERGLDAIVPDYKAQFDLIKNEMIYQGIRPDALVRRRAPQAIAYEHERLVAAANRLMRIVRGARGASGEELRQFGKQVGALADRWDRLRE